MDSGYYAACAGLAARMQALELAANNLANTATTGFKAQQPVFRSLYDQSLRGQSLQEAVNNYGVLAGARVDFTTGNLEATGNDFDLAIDGPGFLVVRTAAGERYTRNGRLQLSSSGELVTADGDRLLGRDGPLRIPTGKMSVGPDGAVSVNGALAGILKMVEFPPGTLLESFGTSYYDAAGAAAREANASRVRQGALESSNVNPVAGAVSVVNLQRHAEMLQRVFSVFQSEFNRIAAEDLPRV